ncbi:WAT1-related protein [Nymphaea thermarum]|nr:WAT1-related protein [Nymphaea thermarum]
MLLFCSIKNGSIRIFFPPELETHLFSPLRLPSRRTMSKYKPYLAMICVHSIYAGMALLTKAALNQGMNHFVFVVYRQAMAAAFLMPIALVFERLLLALLLLIIKRDVASLDLIACISFQDSVYMYLLTRRRSTPCRKKASLLSLQLFCKAFLVSLVGITLSLNLYMIAISYTSATLATATTNIVPVFTFILAVLFRMEILSIRTTYGKLKIVGLVSCLGGGVILALYKGPSIRFLGHHQASSKGVGDAPASGHEPSMRDWIIGTFLMLSSNLTWSFWLLMQVPLLKVYPFKLSLTSLQCLLSALQSALVAFAFERNVSAWRLSFDIKLLSVIYCGVIVTGVTYWLQVWCVAKKGPVFTAIFTPLSLVITIIFSCFFFGDLFYAGR